MLNTKYVVYEKQKYDKIRQNTTKYNKIKHHV